jgi:two-component system, cell cycle response regulator
VSAGATTATLIVKNPKRDSHASLVLIYGGQELGKRFELKGDAIIGREPSCEIVIDMSFVSRQHARMTHREHEWFIEDLGSRNGTQVNGRAVSEPAALMNGDQIKIGGAIFKYLAGGNVEALFHEEIYRMTIFDGLTKIHNKRYLLDFLDREIARARRYGSPLSVAMIDIDHFKAINDTHGHQAGDFVLEQAASRIAALVRREQLVARYGGEEFMLVLPELERGQVADMCESIRRAAEAEPFVFDAAEIRATISIGAAMLDESMDRDAVIHAADAQLYAAKGGGRNRVAMA